MTLGYKQNNVEITAPNSSESVRKTDDILSTLFTVQMLISSLFQPKTQDAAYYINIAIIKNIASGLFAEVI